jgi:hypothetical protein
MKVSPLLMFREIIAVYHENPKGRIDRLCVKNGGWRHVEAVGT